MGRVYTNDVGTLIKLDTGESLAMATAHRIIAKPLRGGVAVELAATIVEGTKLQHVK